MSSRQLVGKCGIYCGSCTIYVARDSEALRQKLAEKYHCLPDQVKCNGCGGLTSECWGNDCKIVLCTRAKGVNFCHQCPDYSQETCEKFNGLRTSYLKAGVDIRQNSSRIQAGDTDRWLAESAERFKCKACGKPVSVWFTECQHCGSSLK